ncbi:MAG: FMN-binding negative transcriptional regulator [Actinomycetota bacterium]|nr:FMN-binding negative transcriptional regulator [Actinomycetota bacterium]
MLIRPWDAAVGASEWQEWLAAGDHFGLLAVNNLDPTHAPVVVPTHFAYSPGDSSSAGDSSLAGGSASPGEAGTPGDVPGPAGGAELLVHLARGNPVWPHLEAAAEVRLAVVGDHAYIPTYWRAEPGRAEEDGVPTSYYSAIEFLCHPKIVDDPSGKAEILASELAQFQPEGRHSRVDPDAAPYGPMLAAIRAVRLLVLAVDAKFKYDDQRPAEHRTVVAGLLEQRGRPLDAAAADQQRRRLAEVGNRHDHRPEPGTDALAPTKPECLRLPAGQG